MNAPSVLRSTRDRALFTLQVAVLEAELNAAMLPADPTRYEDHRTDLICNLFDWMDQIQPGLGTRYLRACYPHSVFGDEALPDTRCEPPEVVACLVNEDGCIFFGSPAREYDLSHLLPRGTSGGTSGLRVLARAVPPLQTAIKVRLSGDGVQWHYVWPKP